MNNVAHPNGRASRRHRRSTMEDARLRSSLPPNSARQSSQLPSLRSSLPPNLNVMNIADIEPYPDKEGDSKAVVYKKGMHVLYKTPNGLVPARILEAHLDGSLEPYYTILREDTGVEKQTDNDHLSLYPDPPHIELLKTEPPLENPERTILHRQQGDFWDDGLHVMTLDEQHEKRKKKGLCAICGEVQTHKPGLWRPWIPDNVEGLIYKGICLKCNSLDEAKMKLGEPVLRMKSRVPTTKITRRPGSPGAKNGQSSLFRRRSTSDNHRRRSLAPGFMRRTSVSNPVSSVMPSPSPPNFFAKKTNDEKRTVPETERGHFGLTTAPMDSTCSQRQNFEEHPRIHLINGINENHFIFAQPPKHQSADNLSENLNLAPPLPPNPPVKTELPQNNGTSDKPEGFHLGERFPLNNEDFECSIEPPGLAEREVHDYRCSDSDGFGFFTGTVATLHLGTGDEEHVPHGEGEMVYDDGKITNGVWSKGILEMKIPSDHERYEPYLLPEYSIGDVGRNEDMITATKAAASKLQVGDCSFVRRSNGSWTYAVVVSRSDFSLIKLKVNSRGSTKSISIAQWDGHMKLPAKPKPDSLPGYSIGNPGRKSDMIFASERDTVISVSTLRIDDAAFVRRSDGSWTYAIVSDITDGDTAKITFEINARGSTKSIQISKCGACIRRIKQKKPPKRQRIAATREEGDTGHDSLQERKFSVPKISNTNKDQNLDAEKLRSSLEQEPQSQILEVYRDLDQKYNDGSIGSDTNRSQYRRSCNNGQGVSNRDNLESPQEVLAIYDNHHHEIDDVKILTDEGGSSAYSSLTDRSKERSRLKEELLMSLISRRRRQTSQENGTDEDSIDSLTESLVRKMERRNSLDLSLKSSHRQSLRNSKTPTEDLTDEGYSSLSDGSRRSRRAQTRDCLLANLLAQAAMADLKDGVASVDFSLDESLASLKESFKEWRRHHTKSKKDKKKKKHRHHKNKKSKKDKKKYGDELMDSVLMIEEDKKSKKDKKKNKKSKKDKKKYGDDVTDSVLMIEE